MNHRIIHIGVQQIDMGSPVVMAIINVTPDSFWHGSRNANKEEIKKSIAAALENGASILDIGGYSSRPGAEDISVEEEYRRVAQALEVIRTCFGDVPVSIDTFRSEIARRSVSDFGECIINDISAGELDPGMISTVAQLKVPYIAMHMRANPATMQSHTGYTDVTQEVKTYLDNKIRTLEDAGIKDIIIDPGFGFAKTTRENYQLMKGMDKLLDLGRPLLSGISRKSMIYKVLGTTPEFALNGTTALNWESLRQGASILRVHDVKETKETIELFKYYMQDGQRKPDDMC